MLQYYIRCTHALYCIIYRGDSTCKTHMHDVTILLLYSRKIKIWRFGGLYYNHQIRIHQNFLLAYIRTAILYRTAKFKSTNIDALVILGSTAKL